MDIYTVFDLFLYIAMLVDLFIRYIKLRSNIKFLGDYHRYHRPFTTVKKIVFGSFILVNIGYIIYRLVMIQSGVNVFNRLCLILPICLYYVILELVFNGIYYSQRGIYVKSDLILMATRTRSYRYFNKEKNRFEYTFYYRKDKTGELEMNFNVKNEKEAFMLMNYLPFDNDPADETNY